MGATKISTAVALTWLIALDACGASGGNLFGDGGYPDQDANDACAPDGGCVCAPGAARCVAGSPTVEETCVAPDGGAGEWKSQDCMAGEVCLPDAGCGTCPEPCQLDTITCDTDMKTVLACSSDPATGCLALLPVVSCPAEGMASCQLPPIGFIITSVKQYCLNACGGRGVPLSAKPCDPAPSPPCASLVCDPDTQMLLPDHTACLGGGLGCQKNSDCQSCRCENGVCIGNMKNNCSTACP